MTDEYLKHRLMDNKIKLVYNGKEKDFKIIVNKVKFKKIVDDNKKNALSETDRTPEISRDTIIMKHYYYGIKFLKKIYKFIKSLNIEVTDEAIDFDKDHKNKDRKWQILKYDKGGNFKEHEERQLGINHIGTMLLIPSKNNILYEGGHLCIKRKDNKKYIILNKDEPNSSDTDENIDEYWRLIILPLTMKYNIDKITKGTLYCLKAPLFLDKYVKIKYITTDKFKIKEDELYMPLYLKTYYKLEPIMGKDVTKTIFNYAKRYLLQTFIKESKKQQKKMKNMENDMKRLEWLLDKETYETIYENIVNSDNGRCYIHLIKYYKNPDLDKLDNCDKKLINEIYKKVSNIKIKIGNIFAGLDDIRESYGPLCIRWNNERKLNSFESEIEDDRADGMTQSYNRDNEVGKYVREEECRHNGIRTTYSIYKITTLYITRNSYTS